MTSTKMNFRATPVKYQKGVAYLQTKRQYRRIGGNSLFNYMGNLIVKLRQKGCIRTSETYEAALRSFRNFRNGEDIKLKWLTSDIMEAYEAWHRSRGTSTNTISFYNRILRAVYNRAVEDELIDNLRPFRHVYTGIDKTMKRAIPLAQVSKIKRLDLSGNAALDYARDMFMMSFFLRGMSFVDMTYLRKTDLRDGYVFYQRRKTGQQLMIAWTSEMQAIIDKYPKNPTCYLLPIIRRKGVNERSVYRYVGYKINCNLKKIGVMVGAKLPLTMYVARHSWASAAQCKGVPVRVISEGLGHESEATTRIYLASLDTSEVDRANAKILRSL